MGKVNDLALALAGGKVELPAEAEVASNTVTPLPHVGESVAVLHATVQDEKGNSRIRRSGNHKTFVKQVLIGSEHGPRVKVESGDVWDVRLSRSGGTRWETHFVDYRS